MAMAYPTPASSSEIEIENQRSPPTVEAPSASSSTAAGDYRYDVFINHRGPDTKKAFASHLYRRLLSHGFTAFLDQRELQEGLPFPSQIEGAIRSASVHVAIFSQRYAESRWCLHELDLMRKSRAPILPVFYHVEPAELRWTDQNKNGVYAKALDKLQTKTTVDSQTGQEKPRYDSATIQNWRDALSSVADTSGFDLDGSFNGDEDQMLQRLVERVVKIMIKNTRWHVAKYPTGLDDKVEEFETGVLRKQHSGKVHVVGILGLGGAGKTTLALELFNRKRSKYNKSYFLADVRENAKKRSLHSLQRELLKGLTTLDLPINNIYEGIGMLERHLKSSHVLIILDDIDHEDQLDAFLPIKDSLSSESLILITSRYRDVLKKSGVDNLSIYKLTGLTPQHSRELFCSYAFCQPYPLQGFEDLVDEFLEVCKGLPLSLRVLGALLNGNNDKSDWEHILHRVKVPDEIQKRLKISYDKLTKEEKQIFLDIACFFIGEKKNSVMSVWDGDGSGRTASLGFKSLEGKCLIEVDDENIIHMHDHLRDLGREIAEDEVPRRLWRPTENIDDWLHQQSSLIREARGISMRSCMNITSSPKFSWYQRKIDKLCGNRFLGVGNRMKKRFSGIGAMNLQLLSTEGLLLERILKRMHSPNLIWLSWRDCPYPYLPSWIPMKNLRVLRVEGRLLETLWQGDSQVPLQLQELEIIDAHHLSNIPKSIGQLKHLKRLVMSPSFPHINRRLERLPDSFGNLGNLQYIELISFVNLERLPDSFCKLANLKHMDLSGCHKLKRLPESFGNLVNLQHMNLAWCTKLERLPDSIANLRNLQHMDLSSCDELKRLPEYFGNLVNLQHMNLASWSKLERLPDSIGNLRNLQHMNLEYCIKLERLPDSIGNLRNLQHMNLRCCIKLERLPDSIGNLRNLQHMNLNNCEALERLPEPFGNLVNLQHMDLHMELTRSHKLERLPESFGNLVNLQHLDLSGCQKLKLPDSFGNLVNLQHMDLSGCRELERLPDSFGNLVNLQHMDLSGCRELERLPDSFGNLVNLQHMDLYGCQELERLPDSFDNLVNLQYMDLSKCNKLGRLPDSFGNLGNLQHMSLSESEKLERLPNSSGCLSSLESFKASDCSNLTISSDTLGNIRTLESTAHADCEKIEVWSSQLAYQRSLKTLKLMEMNFKELPSAIGGLRDLEVLWIGGPFLDTLPPSLKDLGNLQELKLKDCRELKHLPASVELLTKLTSLVVDNCPAIELPFKMVKGQRETGRTLKSDSSSHKYMSSLRRLILRRDTEISEVSFDESVCPNLQHLALDWCSDLAEVGTLPSTLVHLKCSNLRNIEGLCGPAKLQTQWIHKCTELHGIETLVSLESLNASGCEKLKTIRGLAQLTKLNWLNVEECRELEELEGVGYCISLENLRAKGCEKLKSIGNLAQLTKLRRLDVSGCAELEALEGVEYCISFLHLNASDCPKLQWGKGVVERLRKKHIRVYI